MKTITKILGVGALALSLAGGFAIEALDRKTRKNYSQI
jgi:hypothetical protein